MRAIRHRHGWEDSARLASVPTACCLPGAMPMLLSRLIPAAFVLIWASGFVAARYVAPFAEPLAFVALRLALVPGSILTGYGSNYKGKRDGAG